MEFFKRILLLLALSAGLWPQPTVAQETAYYHPLNESEPPWVVEVDMEAANRLHEEWLKAKQPKKQLSTATQPANYNPCNCVSYTSWRSGRVVRSIGVARNHPVTTQTPFIGAIVVTYESGAGHLSYLVGMDDNFIYVDEANYSRCRVTYNRAIPISSKLIKGYY